MIPTVTIPVEPDQVQRLELKERYEVWGGRTITAYIVTTDFAGESKVAIVTRTVMNPIERLVVVVEE